MNPSTQPEEPRVAQAAHDPEAATLAALRAGDEQAFLALVQRYHASMVRTAQLYVSSRALAEEVVQEAWVGVLEGLDGFEGRCSLRAWVFRILVNCAKTRGVREARSVPLSALARADEDDAPAEPAERFLPEGELWAGHWAEPPAAWQEERVATQEMVALVREALETLPPQQREVMTLRDVEGLDTAEVRELLGLTDGNQRVLLHRARTKVRRFVEERLGQEGQS
jgi:RNA polymerase sigma-70 factor, ECF subfamily